jgi:tetratricopeptide (TPR) repeat protein
MRHLAPRMALAWMLISMPLGTAFGQQAAKDPFIPEANVQNAGIYNDRGIAKQNKGDLDGAMADYNQAIKLDPKLDVAYINRGNVKQKKGDLEGAMADYNQAITLNPKNVLAYRCRGDIKRKKGDLDGAIADYNRAIKLGESTD